jgi:hypothetical protein
MAPYTTLTYVYENFRNSPGAEYIESNGPTFGHTSDVLKLRRLHIYILLMCCTLYTVIEAFSFERDHQDRERP